MRDDIYRYKRKEERKGKKIAQYSNDVISEITNYQQRERGPNATRHTHKKKPTVKKAIFLFTKRAYTRRKGGDGHRGKRRRKKKIRKNRNTQN